MFSKFVRATFLFLGLFIGLFTGLFTASQVFASSTQPFHFEMEGTGILHPNMTMMMSEDDPLQTIIASGERNLKWLQNINAHREDKLSLSSKETQTGHPIEEGHKYNAEIILAKFNDLKTKLPAEMSKIILGGGAFTDDPPIEIAEYLKWGLAVDRLYQTAARWNNMKPYLGHLKQVRNDDVRGYYFLNKDPQRDVDFANWINLAAARRAELSDWLSQICANTEGNFSRCQNDVKALATAEQVQNFFKRYFENSRTHWNSYFAIEDTRNDIKWDQSQQNQMDTFMTDPKIAEVASFLKVNIEDEWKTRDWHLTLNIVPSAKTHVEFQAGATPHVNGIAGNTITMDANAPLTEYDVQWTIRHEFGHVLGFPDCYLEFYDEDQAAIVSYQLDITNLMCSRVGHFKLSHFDELRKSYFNK